MYSFIQFHTLIVLYKRYNFTMGYQCFWGRRGRMVVVEFTIAYAISAYHH
jgi:hypothetical protein